MIIKCEQILKIFRTWKYSLGLQVAYIGIDSCKLSPKVCLLKVSMDYTSARWKKLNK